MPYQACIAEQETDSATKELSRAAKVLRPKVRVEQESGKRFDKDFIRGVNEVEVHLLCDEDVVGVPMKRARSTGKASHPEKRVDVIEPVKGELGGEEPIMRSRGARNEGAVGMGPVACRE